MCLCLLSQRSAFFMGISPSLSPERAGTTWKRSKPSQRRLPSASPLGHVPLGNQLRAAQPSPELPCCLAASWEIINDYGFNPQGYWGVCYVALLWQQEIEWGWGHGEQKWRPRWIWCVWGWGSMLLNIAGMWEADRVVWNTGHHSFFIGQEAVMVSAWQGCRGLGTME